MLCVLIEIETTPENCPIGIKEYSNIQEEDEHLMWINTFLNVISVE